MKSIFFTIIMLFQIVVTASQAQQNETEKTSLFSEGIYISNLKVLLPWRISHCDIQNIGNPKIDSSRKKVIIRWDSVTVLGSIPISFVTLYKVNKCHKKFEIIYGYIHKEDAHRIKQILEDYSLTTAKNLAFKPGKEYFWVIDGCNIRLGYNKRYGNYFWIQRRSYS